MDYTNILIKKVNTKFKNLHTINNTFGINFKLMSPNYLQVNQQKEPPIEINIPDISLSGRNIFGGLIRKKIINQWSDYFDPGIRRNFTKEDIYYSDSSYRVLYRYSAEELVDAIYDILRKSFDLKWTKQVFDCDDFADLADALASVIALKNGLYGVGIGIATIKIGFTNKFNQRAGHALNFLPIYEQNVGLYFYEPQSKDILKIQDYINHNNISNLTIRQFDM